MRSAAIALALTACLIAGCRHVETQGSRDFLNCMYQQQYELGASREDALRLCR